MGQAVSSSFLLPPQYVLLPQNRQQADLTERERAEFVIGALRQPVILQRFVLSNALRDDESVVKSLSCLPTVSNPERLIERLQFCVKHPIDRVSRFYGGFTEAVDDYDVANVVFHSYSGQSLSAWLPARTLDPSLRLSLLFQLATVVRFYNRRSFAHGNLSCDTILVDTFYDEPTLQFPHPSLCLFDSILPSNLESFILIASSLLASDPAFSPSFVQSVLDIELAQQSLDDDSLLAAISCEKNRLETASRTRSLSAFFSSLFSTELLLEYKSSVPAVGISLSGFALRSWLQAMIPLLEMELNEFIEAVDYSRFRMISSMIESEAMNLPIRCVLANSVDDVDDPFGILEPFHSEEIPMDLSSLLLIAVRRGNAKITEILLTLVPEVDVQVVDALKRNVFHFAAFSSSIEVFRLLMDGFDSKESLEELLMVRDEIGLTPLRIAVIRGSVAIVERIISVSIERDFSLNELATLTPLITLASRLAISADKRQILLALSRLTEPSDLFVDYPASVTAASLFDYDTISLLSTYDSSFFSRRGL